MTPWDILRELWLREVTQKEIAKKCGVSHTMIHQVIYGKSKSRRIQKEIAGIIGKDVNEVWPRIWNRYGAGQNVSAINPDSVQPYKAI